MYVIIVIHCWLNHDIQKPLTLRNDKKGAHNNISKQVYVIAWFVVVFGINNTSKAEVIAQGAAEFYLLPYGCY